MEIEEIRKNRCRKKIIFMDVGDILTIFMATFSVYMHIEVLV